MFQDLEVNVVDKFNLILLRKINFHKPSFSGIEPARDLTWQSEEFKNYMAMMIQDPNRQFVIKIEGEDDVGRYKVSLQVEDGDIKVDIATDMTSIGIAKKEVSNLTL